MNELIAELESIEAEIENEFGELSEEALNWKPGAEMWSIGQCLDHLVVTNSKEILAFERAIEGKHTSTVWERLPLLPGFFGSFLIRAVDPDVVKRHSAPKVFEPSQSEVSKGVIGDYKKASKQIRGFVKDFEGQDTSKIVITSPVARFATYSLENAFKFVALHDRRHVNQAKRVKESVGFPN